VKRRAADLRKKKNAEPKPLTVQPVGEGYRAPARGTLRTPGAEGCFRRVPTCRD
jgi:hypothetical protein